MSSALLERLALFSRRRYRLVFAVFGVLVLASLLSLSRLSLETDMLRLLPQEEPVVRDFVDTMTRFGRLDYLLVAVRIPEGQVLAPYQTFADELALRLEEMPEIEKVEYRIGDLPTLFESFASKAVLFLGEDERQALLERVSDRRIVERVEEMRRLLATPQGMMLRDLVTLDPLGLAEIFLDRRQGSRGDLRIDWQSGYFLSRDHTLMLLLAAPTEPPQNLGFAQRLAARVEEEAARVRSEWPRIVGQEEGPTAAGGGEAELLVGEVPPPPEVAMGGSYLTTVDEARFIQRDVVINIVTALVLVLGLFLLAFRRLGPLLYAAVPLACGLVLTFGFAALTLGKLSTATSGTAALLIGLGIDFVIVSYGRFVEERREGRSLDAAIAAMASRSGRAVLVGAVTTAATFYAFLVTDFRGLWEMGFLTGTGILFCMASVLLLLPALLAWHEAHYAARETEPSFYLHGFGTDRLIRFSLRHRRWVVAVGVAITVVTAVLASGLRFESDMMAMRPKGNRGIEVAQEIGRKFGSGFNYMMLRVEGASAGEVLEASARAADAAEELVAEGILYRVDSVASLVPPPERQRQVIDWLAEERRDALDPERIRATFERALAAEGLRFEPFRRGLDLLVAALSPTEPLDLEEMRASPESRQLVDRYVQPAGDGWQALVYLYPPENRYRREPPPEAVALAEGLGPGIALIGNNVINGWVRGRITRDAWTAGILGFVLVGFLIYLDFGRLRDTLGALTPLLVGIVWMLGAMAVLGIDLNFMNIFVTTMIIGIGVDYGLHILHRYREVSEAGEAEFEAGLLQTGKAILVAALSTICGFGSMAVSHYPGLRTTGYVAILGALATALVAITLLPAWFAVRREVKAKRRARALGP